jgi:hypothetical protein
VKDGSALLFACFSNIVEVVAVTTETYYLWNRTSAKSYGRIKTAINGRLNSSKVESFEAAFLVMIWINYKFRQKT